MQKQPVKTTEDEKAPKAAWSGIAEATGAESQSPRSKASIPTMARGRRLTRTAKSLSPEVEPAARASAMGNRFVVRPEERLRLIAEAAYYRAERRGFQGGEEASLEDWLEAEAEIDPELAKSSQREER